jgi:hypothetical protein
LTSFTFHEKPKDKKATYGRVVCTVRPQKKEQNRTRITVGGNLIDYPGDVSTRTADLTTFKTHLNSVISTPGAKYMCMDVGNFYLMTPLDEPEYMRFHISLIPDEIIEAYDLTKSSTPMVLYTSASKRQCMDSRKADYSPTNSFANVLHHMDTTNALTHQVFGNMKHDPSRSHLLLMTLASNTSTKKMHNTLNESFEMHYSVTCDWEGSLYCGITIKWDYINAESISLCLDMSKSH